MLKENQGSINGIKTENTSNQNQRKTKILEKLKKILLEKPLSLQRKSRRPRKDFLI